MFTKMVESILQVRQTHTRTRALCVSLHLDRQNLAVLSPSARVCVCRVCVWGGGFSRGALIDLPP